MVHILYIVVHYKPFHGTYSTRCCKLQTRTWNIFYTQLYITNLCMVHILYIVVHQKPVYGSYSIRSCTLQTCTWFIFYTQLYITNLYMVHILYIVVHYKPVHGSYSIYSCTLQTCTWCSGATVARLTPDQKAARSISSFLLVGFRIYIICFLIFPFPETSFFL